MPIGTALEVLLSDARLRTPVAPPLTRYRLASALKKGLLATLYDSGLRAWGGPVGAGGALPAGVGLAYAQQVDAYWVTNVRGQRFVTKSLMENNSGGSRPVASNAAERRALSDYLVDTAVHHSAEAAAQRRLLVQVEELAATTYRREPRARRVFAAIAPGLAPDVDPATVLFNARNWNTTVWLDAFGRVYALSRVELRGTVKKLSPYANPMAWSKNGTFWDLSQRLTVDSRQRGLFNRDPSWKGLLREVVRGIVLLDVVLDIRYTVSLNRVGRPDLCTVIYELPPGNEHRENLTADDGYSRLEEDHPRSGWVTGEIYKRLGFAPGPYGDLSGSAVLAPSIIGSWLRLQLDLWASRAG
jgi:hypothetical protein